MLHTLGIHAHSIINLGLNHKSELFYFYSNGTDIVWWLLVVVIQGVLLSSKVSSYSISSLGVPSSLS